jgi:Ni/Fe-hydrogenase 1 B-type cytochrome subunit
MEDKACQYRTYLWEFPVRLNHWINVFSIITLAATGFFIGTPLLKGSGPFPYVMGWVRFIHFVAGYLFTISVLMRIYWSFVGNRYASWREFFPLFTADGRKRVLAVFKYYTFMTHQVPETEGHNPLAATAYTGVFACYVTLIATGFSLYSQYAPHSWMATLFSPLHLLFSNQGMRLTHHLLMWLILAFIINHIYSGWLMDIKERCGEISSIFSGSKFIHRKEKK